MAPDDGVAHGHQMLADGQHSVAALTQASQAGRDGAIDGAALLPTRTALQMMAEAVRRGDMGKARALGQQSSRPLALDAADLTGFSGGRVLAQGAQGKVVLCTWQGQPVAVKVPRLGTTADMERFRHEVELMSDLGDHTHHIMPLLGARCLPPGYMLVMPLSGPSLAHLLYGATPAWRPVWGAVLRVAVQLATALARLHAAGVVHRDIKTDNVLVASSTFSTSAPGAGQERGGEEEEGEEQEGGASGVHVLLSDLGLACHQQDLQVASSPSVWAAEVKAAVQAGGGGTAARRLARPTGGFHKQDAVGTQEYCGPELLMHSAPHSAASDVFALAVTLNELTTRTRPYSDCTRDGPPGLHTVLDHGYTRQQLAAAVAGEGLRPRLPQRPTPPGWCELLEACWAHDVQARPSAPQLLEQLLHLQRAVLPAWRAQQRQQRQRARGGGLEGAAGGGVGDASLRLERGDGDVVMMEVDVPPGGVVAAAEGSKGLGDGAGGVVDVELEAWLGQLREAGVWHWDCAVVAEAPAPLPPQGPPGGAGGVVAAGVVEALGGRDTWEDRHVLLPDWTLLPAEPCRGEGEEEGAEPPPGVREAWGAARLALQQLGPCALFAVFDGHRGTAAAEACAREVAGLVRREVGRRVRAHLSERRGGAQALGGAVLRGALAQGLRAALLALEQEVCFPRWEAERRAAALQQQAPPSLGHHGSTGSLEPGSHPPGPAGALPHSHSAAALRASPLVARQFPGCTATVALLAGGVLTVANVGDGRAVLGTLPASTAQALGGEAGAPVTEGQTVALTRAHAAASASERARLRAQGLSAPVWHGQGAGWRLPGCGLQVSRSVGDYDAKDLRPFPPPPAHSPSLARQGTGLTSEPEVTQVELSARHGWLVLGSDGLWDVLGDGVVARLLADTVKHPGMAARRLVAEALDAGTNDNVTALVAFLQPVTTLERVFAA